MDAHYLIVKSFTGKSMFSLNIGWVFCTPEARLVKMAYSVPHLFQFIPVQVWDFSLEFYNMFKGNPNFWGILNWIIQILYYHCRKQHKNIEKLTDYWTKCCYLSALLSIYCNLCFLHLCQQQDFFSSWTVLSEF